MKKIPFFESYRPVKKQGFWGNGNRLRFNEYKGLS